MDQYFKMLKDSGLSNTKPRLAIFNLLKNNSHQPMDTRQLIDDCKIFADRSTVYRSLESLEKAGIIRKVYQGWKYKLELSEEFHGHHHHIICNLCKKTLPVELNSDIENSINQIAKNLDYSSADHQLEINGICPNCQKTRNPDE